MAEWASPTAARDVMPAVHFDSIISSQRSGFTCAARRRWAAAWASLTAAWDAAASSSAAALSSSVFPSSRLTSSSRCSRENEAQSETSRQAASQEGTA